MAEKGERHTYRFLVTDETRHRCCSYEKRTLAKKGRRARVSSGAQLIEVHLCARPAARRNENAVRDNDGYRDIHGVYFRPSPSGSYSRRRISNDARGGDDDGLEDAREDGH